MTRAPRQLTFPLDGPPRFSAEDFLVTSANAAAHAILAAWPGWPARGLLIVGPEGSGKSHLAAIWAGMADAAIVEGAELTLDTISALREGSALVLENADFPGVSEPHLFHLLNAMRERGLWIVLTASRGPDLLWPRLPDLASRLRALPRAELSPPGDDLVRAVLVKLFDDRQLAVEADVIDYVARRMERSLSAARDIVAALDDEALALGRRITRPVAAAVLARLDQDGE